MEEDHCDEWKPQFGAAIVTGASAAIATVVSAELAVRVTALVTLLASLAGWAAA